MQSQLGVVMAFVAFLPLIIFILTNKKIDGKSKAILGSIAGVALVIAGIGGAEFNPASVEKYTRRNQYGGSFNRNKQRLLHQRWWKIPYLRRLLYDQKQ